MTIDPLLSIRGLRRTFEAELAPVRALRGVDLDVAPGEFVAVMGPSGCGKSTLLNLVAGLDVPDDGRIVIDQEDVTGQDTDSLARMRRRHIGFVFQFFNLLDDLLGIGDKASQHPAVLSGGQRQRLAIARALANTPTLLLADEPTGALDSDSGREIVELFRRLHANESQTIVMVTHSADVAAGAERTVTMRDGRILTGAQHEGAQVRPSQTPGGDPVVGTSR